jgi:hypothetical protein
MSMADTIKSNPGKILLGSASSIIAIVGALFTLDARYAHAAEVEKDKVQTQRIIKETSQTLRKQMLEDKLFELDVKEAQARGKLDPVEAALKERYKRQIEEITRSQGK